MANFSRQVRRNRINVCYQCLQCLNMLGMACVVAGGTIDPFTMKEVGKDDKEKTTAEDKSV